VTGRFQGLAGRLEPLRVAPGQDHLGARLKPQGGQDRQADLARAAEQQDP